MMRSFEVMAQPFMAIPQAVGVSAEKELAAGLVADFVRAQKANGLVRQSLVRSGHADVTVPA